MSDVRAYPERPYLAVSAAIIRDSKVLVVRRARKPALNLYTLPGGAVELGETLHEAVMMQESATAPPDSVLQVLQSGYQLNGRLLRPARVVVARAPHNGA